METRLLAACPPGWETILADEVGLTLDGASARALEPGWVLATGARAGADEPVLAFATQALPDVEPLPAPSVAAAADQLADRIVGALAAHDGTWRLHVFCVEWPGSPVRGARCELIAREALARLRRRRRALLRTRVTGPAMPFAPGEWLLQMALVTPQQGWFAATSPVARARWRHCLSRFPGGMVDVPDDARPPSRAYRKLVEAQAHLGRTIAAGESVVDLGAAPGGWTHIALMRGASVTAIDRSPLRADLMAHPRLTFRRGDAFAFAPEHAPVDWLLCDVIAFPARSLELLARWLGEGWCRRFVVTVKFRGQDDYPLLDRLKRILSASGAEFLLRRLGHNKNEVTAMGSLAP